jgi:DNA mismatch repair ATPase MutS
MYEGDKYNLRKIRDFSDILSGFENLLKISQVFKGKDINTSILLKKCVKSTEEGGRFPLVEMDKLLKHYRVIFDEKQAKKDGIIKPRPGVDPIYDSAIADVAKIETEFQEYLREMKRSTGINDINYWGNNKDRYQLEVPNNSCNKVPRVINMQINIIIFLI